MSGNPQIPSSISHKGLNHFMDKAKNEDLIYINNDHEWLSKEKENFKELLESWNSISKEILLKIANKESSITNGKSSRSIMALGAMEAHINMAKHALKAFQEGE